MAVVPVIRKRQAVGDKLRSFAETSWVLCMKCIVGVVLAAILIACSGTSPTNGFQGISSTLRDDGVWEIVYVLEAALPRDGEVTSLNVRAPIEDEAARLCPTGIERLELSPVSLGAGPGGLGLVTRTTGLATCKSAE